jgi:hypothetical protein
MTDRPEIPDDIDEFLEGSKGKRMFMVTLRKDGSPTCHPMARFYNDRMYLLNMYAASQKHKNLDRDPRIFCLSTEASDAAEMRPAMWRGHARLVDADETLSRDAPKAVVEARGIGMEGVKAVEDAPEKFLTEEPTDWLKRASVMVERIRDRVRLLWEIVPEQVDWLKNTR